MYGKCVYVCVYTHALMLLAIKWDVKATDLVFLSVFSYFRQLVYANARNLRYISLEGLSALQVAQGAMIYTHTLARYV